MAAFIEIKSYLGPNGHSLIFNFRQTKILFSHTTVQETRYKSVFRISKYTSYKIVSIVAEEIIYVGYNVPPKPIALWG